MVDYSGSERDAHSPPFDYFLIRKRPEPEEGLDPVPDLCKTTRLKNKEKDDKQAENNLFHGHKDLFMPGGIRLNDFRQVVKEFRCQGYKYGAKDGT